MRYRMRVEYEFEAWGEVVEFSELLEEKGLPPDQVFINEVKER